MKLPPSLKDNPRALAVQILNRVDDEQAFAEPLLDSVLSAGHPPAEADRGLLTFLVYGTLRMRGLLDFLIDRFYRGKPATLEPGVRNILRVALYQRPTSRRRRSSPPGRTASTGGGCPTGAS